LAAEPVIHVGTPSLAEVGEAVLTALSTYVDGAPHPTEWKGIGKPFLAATGYRSYKSLHSRAKMVHVDVDGDLTRLVPTLNGGSTGPDRGFTELPDKAVALRTGAPAETLGEAVIRALDLCEQVA
jgi:hypothetical protein